MASTGLIPPLHLPLFSGRQTSGAAIPAAATTGTFGCTVGTLTGAGAAGQSAMLVSEVANGGNKTDTVIYDLMFDRADFAGSTITLTVYGLHTRAGGAGTCTIDASVRKISTAGVTSAELTATAAQALDVGSADTAEFTIDASSLAYGDRITIAITATLTVADANNNTCNIYAVKLS